MSGILLASVGNSYGAPPLNTVAPAVTGTASFGSTLTTTNGTWTGLAPITFTYQWQRVATNISGATSSTYVLVAADVGNTIRCVVKATNSVAPSGVTANSNSTASVAAVVPGAPTIGTATATGSSTATVVYTAPASNGGATITQYTATSSPSGITGTLSQAGSGTITVSGLAPLTSYTFTVTATNSAGTSAASAASNSVTTQSAPALYTWGMNDFGQLGLGTSGGGNYKSSPTQVGALTTWYKITGGKNNTTSLKNDGTLWTWGQNGAGKLGLGNTTNYSSPMQIGGLTDWLKIANGEDHCLAIKTDGTIWSWGLNNRGQLGLGNTSNRSSPSQIGALTNWLSVSAGYGHSLATKTDGTIWSWGSNVYGQLGINASVYTNYSSPSQIGSLTTWSIIAADKGNSSLAVKTDGTLWAWGRNTNGQLGTGNTTSRSSPVQIGGLTTWSKLASGLQFSMAIKTDGTIWSWGQNQHGQLGNNSAYQYSSPVQIGALTTWLRKYYGLFLTQAGRQSYYMVRYCGRQQIYHSPRNLRTSCHQQQSSQAFNT